MSGGWRNGWDGLRLLTSPPELRKSNELKRIQETLIAEELSIYEKEQDALLQSGELINVFFSVRHGDDGPVSPAHVFYIALLATV